ncbi:MAG: Phosphonate ABC transporter permease protein phnE [uncultured Chloroflexia bacterium]|uniref:Phosphonate ABC transporter permease protein phnE n=1 Tax=uncultured Chloroflexia bacterium TaxID=1672391 RepID=A0A6J4GY45_9CHLR|nr:MAG: Phosphonate ABC transporter permease protein phnE [uncultured Chloroflexia bacterium]
MSVQTQPSLSAPPAVAPSRRSRVRRWFWFVLIAVLLVWAADATAVDPARLVTDVPKVRGILTDLFQPSLATRGAETQQAFGRVEVPCVSGIGSPPSTEEGPALRFSSSCLNARDSVTISGTGFRPDTQGRIYWQPPQSQGRLRDERFTTDAAGAFSVETDIPPLLAERGGETEVSAELVWQSGRLRPSEALTTTLRALLETIFLALMATTLGAIVAIPVAFLGARNLMPHTPLGNAAYTTTRAVFNLARAVEPLILATIFAIWVGFGPFAGVLALSVSTIANIGKLYAEAAESINMGPLEALRASGANELQVIGYGVVPQLVPPYLSFTIYYWDINVRMSTIIGFVGGGGIGLELSRWINQLQWNNAATAVWGIVIVVLVMDYASAVVREKIT